MSETDLDGVQRALAARVIRVDDDLGLAAARAGLLVAGADVAFVGDRARAAVAVLRLPDLEVVDEVVIERPIEAEYVPGHFAARELPPLELALARLRVAPDVILCDGHGIAHPRRCGLASHLGVTLGLRTIGCAKTLLVGAHGALAPARGASADLVVDGEVVGAAVRTSDGVRPVYVSIGHRVSLATAIAVVVACSRTRIPEPLRRADQLSKRGALT